MHAKYTDRSPVTKLIRKAALAVQWIRLKSERDKAVMAICATMAPWSLALVVLDGGRCGTFQLTATAIMFRFAVYEALITSASSDQSLPLGSASPLPSKTCFLIRLTMRCAYR